MEALITRPSTKVAIERENLWMTIQCADLRCTELETAGVGEDDAEFVRLVGVIAAAVNRLDSMDK